MEPRVLRSQETDEACLISMPLWRASCSCFESPFQNTVLKSPIQLLNLQTLFKSFQNKRIQKSFLKTFQNSKMHNPFFFFNFCLHKISVCVKLTQKFQFQITNITPFHPKALKIINKRNYILKSKLFVKSQFPFVLSSFSFFYLFIFFYFQYFLF